MPYADSQQDGRRKALFYSVASQLAPILMKLYKAGRSSKQRAVTDEQITRLATWLEDIVASQQSGEDLLNDVGGGGLILFAFDAFSAISEERRSYLLGSTDNPHLEPFQLLFSLTESRAADALEVPNHSSYHQLRTAIANRDFHRIDGSDYPCAILRGVTLDGHAELRPVLATSDAESVTTPEEDAEIEFVWQILNELSDLDADVLDAVCHVWIQQADSPQHHSHINIDSVLNMRGILKKKSGNGRRGGYRPEQRMQIQLSLERIATLWLNLGKVIVYVPKGHSKRAVPKVITMQSRAFTILARTGQCHLDGSFAVEGITYTLGPLLATFLFGSGRQVALLPIKALAYDCHTKKYHKRLARFFSHHFRIRATTLNYCQPFIIRNLLDRISYKIDLGSPTKVRTLFENIMTTFVTDRVIAGWQYKTGFEEPTGYRWLEAWLSSSVIVEPSPETIAKYRKLAERRPRKAIDLADTAMPVQLTIEEEINNGVTRLQLAERIGVSARDLLRVEHGRPVTSDVANKFKKFAQSETKGGAPNSRRPTR